MYEDKRVKNAKHFHNNLFFCQASMMYSERRKRMEEIKQKSRKTFKKKKKVKVKTEIEEDEEDEDSDDERVRTYFKEAAVKPFEARW